MCLPLKPYKIEKEWNHAGLDCVVVMAREAAHRCGYVRVPPTHPMFSKSYYEPNVEVHGGLTFAELEPCAQDDGQGWWFGFDCAHSGDASTDPDVDPETLSAEAESIREIYQRYPMSRRGEVYRSQFYVERECESLADQLMAMA
jgi:hypothetical protein